MAKPPAVYAIDREIGNVIIRSKPRAESDLMRKQGGIYDVKYAGCGHMTQMTGNQIARRELVKSGGYCKSCLADMNPAKRRKVKPPKPSTLEETTLLPHQWPAIPSLTYARTSRGDM